jgi:LmbE family N-acetylglucosaminyl deacetylase
MISEDRIIPYQVSELPVEQGPWLVLAPHADDETFGMGGTILKAVERGMVVEVIIMTDGSLGGRQANLAQIRKKEAKNACKSLGTKPPVFLDNPDRGLENNKNTQDQVMEQIQNICPSAVFFPGAFELHPDHRITAMLAWRCLQTLGRSAPIPVSYEVLTQSPVNTLVDITSYIQDKEAVMGNYSSQLTENNYVEIAKSLNRLRSLTLPGDVTFAEGFYRFHQDDLHRELKYVVLDKITPLFDL